MLKTALPLFAALLVMGCAAKEEAAPPPDGPALKLTGRVVDAADILSPEFEATMTARLKQLEDDTLVQLVVATTPSLDGKEINRYTFDLANAWGLGDAKRNDGLLVLVAPNERKVRIEVGLGLEKTVTNEEAAQILDTYMLPPFGKAQYEAGIRAGIDALAREVTPVEMEKKAA